VSGEWTSNHVDCLRGLIGRTITGVINPWPGISVTTAKALVLDDGTAFVFSANGSFWRERADEVERVVKHKRDELEHAMSELQHVLAADGLLSALKSPPSTHQSDGSPTSVDGGEQS
jgi:hypothetical protein